MDASSGDSGAYSDPRWGTPVKEVSLPASDPLVLAVGGTELTANPSTGAYLGETAWGGETGFVQTSGGSGGGLIALADQYAHHDLGFVNPTIYRIARSSSYHKAFHDITIGSNTVTIGTVTVGYQAGPGWDPVTGWGSPSAPVLIPLLARG